MLGRASLFQCIAVALATYVVAAALIGCSPERDANSRLVIAARQGSLVQVKALIAEGVDVNGREMVIGQGRSALFHASAEGHVDVVRYLLERGAEVDEAPAGRSTALIVASWEGHREIVRLLISSRADVNRKNENGWTALSSAARNGHLGIVEDLLGAGADATIRHPDGNTAADVARSHGHNGVAELIERSISKK